MNYKQNELNRTICNVYDLLASVLYYTVIQRVITTDFQRSNLSDVADGLCLASQKIRHGPRRRNRQEGTITKIVFSN